MRKLLKYLLKISIALLLVFSLLGIYLKFYILEDKILFPVQNFLYKKSIAINDFYHNFTKYKDLEKENQDLLEKNVQLELFNSKLLKYKEENEALKKSLNFLDKQSYSYIMANVIAKSADENEQILFIDKGLDDGIKESSAVIVYDGILLGKVVEVYKHYSKIRLLIDANSSVAASIQNIDKTIGLVNGVYGLSLRMSLVPSLENVNIGDKVISSGLELGIPKDLLIGEVDQIDYKQGDLFKTLSIKPIIDFNKITIVAVLDVDY